MKQIVILSLMSICILISLSAAWLNDVPVTITQPDGKKIEAFVSGDEFHNWRHDKYLYTIIQDPKTGYWCWAKAENGNLISTGYPIHQYSPQSLGLQAKENISTERYQEKARRMQAPTRDIPSRTPTVGTIQNIIIFIRFADDTEFSRDQG